MLYCKHVQNLSSKDRLSIQSIMLQSAWMSGTNDLIKATSQVQTNPSACAGEAT